MRSGTETDGNRLVHAVLANLETLERVEFLWNPERYEVRRSSRFAGLEGLGGGQADFVATGAGECFITEVLLDASRGGGRVDLQETARRIAGWRLPPRGSWAPPRLLFSWGSFRFRGFLERVDESWVRFRPDGTPVRGWLRLSLRG